MSFRNAYAIVGIFISTTSVFAAGCHVDPSGAVYGQDTDVRMISKSGNACGVGLRSKSTLGISISSKAQHGIVSLSKERVMYTSARGFVGSDSFVFEKYGEAFDKNRGTHVQGITHYIVSVEVTP